MTAIALGYLAVGLVLILQGMLRRTVRIRAFDDLLWIAGAGLLWPVVFVTETAFAVRQWRFERQQWKGRRS